MFELLWQSLACPLWRPTTPYWHSAPHVLFEIQYPAGRRGNDAEFKTGHPPPFILFFQLNKEPEGAMKKISSRGHQADSTTCSAFLRDPLWLSACPFDDTLPLAWDIICHDKLLTLKPRHLYHHRTERLSSRSLSTLRPGGVEETHIEGGHVCTQTTWNLTLQMSGRSSNLD